MSFAPIRAAAWSASRPGNPSIVARNARYLRDTKPLVPSRRGCPSSRSRNWRSAWVSVSASPRGVGISRIGSHPRPEAVEAEGREHRETEKDQGRKAGGRTQGRGARHEVVQSRVGKRDPDPRARHVEDGTKREDECGAGEDEKESWNPGPLASASSSQGDEA